MKSLIMVFSFVGSMAYACPNLSGEFIATLDYGNTERLVITQSELNGTTTYSLNFDDTYSLLAIADGITRTIESNDSYGLKNSVEDTYVCSENKLINTYKERYLNPDGSLQYEEKGTKSISLDASGNLLDHTEYSNSDGEAGVKDVTYIKQ